MRIALFITGTPFVRGGSEILVEDLRKQLEARGHEAELFRIPFIEEFHTGIFLNALSAQLLDFDDFDLLISFKWPAYLAVHRRKVFWVFHQFRQAYDLFGKQFGLPHTDMGAAIKKMVEQTDAVAFEGGSRVYALSNAANRLGKYCGIGAEVMHTPLPNLELYGKNSFGDYIYCACRIDDMKRQALMVEAMRYVKSGVKLVIDGKCDDEALLGGLRDAIRKYGLGDKVALSAEFVPEKTKIDRYANCLAGIYVPIDEDSTGIVLFEAFYSHKTLITTADSGGVADFVNDGENAFIVEPSPRAIAEKMDYLYENKGVAEQMGRNAHGYIVGMDVNWDDTIRRLLG